MPWNTLRKWLKPSPAKRTIRPRQRTWLQIETLETRYAPAFTVGPNINVTRSGADDAENMIVVNPLNPLNLFATSTGSGARRFSLNGGVSWANSNFGPIFGGSTGGDEQAAWDEFGNLFVTYFAVDSAGATHTVVALSTNGGANFTLSLDTFFDFPPGGFGDQPSIATGAGSVWVCYDPFGAGGAGLNQIIRGAAVTGLGQVGPWGFEFEAPGVDGQFGDIAVGPNGQVFLVYQQPTGEAPSFIFGNLDPDGLGPLPPGGGLIPAQVVITQTNVGTFDVIPAQPNRTIDAEANLAWDRSGSRFHGRLYMVFTDETFDESNDTDIFVTYSDTNGASWSPRIRINDDSLFNGRSQFLPAIALDQTTGNVAVAWYDNRNDPRNTRPEVWMTVSHDGGATWLPNQRVSQGQSVAPPGSGFDFGDYNKATFHAGRFYYAWGDNSNSTMNNPAGRNGPLDLYTAMVTVTGAPAPIIPPDNFESNDRSDKATKLGKITAARTLNASIKNKPTRLDQDWYRFNLEGTGTLTVTLTPGTPPGDLDMRLWTVNSAGTLVLLQSSTTRSATATETITFPYSGEVKRLFIQVYGFGGAESPYTITFTP